MKNERVSPLVITPRPFKRESILGYLLRTTDENGYESMSQILRYAGLRDSSLRTFSEPYEKILPLFGEDDCDYKNEIINLDYIKISKKRNLRRLDVKHSAMRQHLNVRFPKICPQCVIKNGYVDIYWDIKYVECCPKHFVKLIDSCPSCHKRLSWFRPGLVKCRCGYDLSKEKGEDEYDENILITTGFIHNLLYRKKSLHRITLNGDYPIVGLEGMSINGFLWLAYRLHDIYHLDTAYENENKNISVIKLISNVLYDWPYGFYRYLDNLCNFDKKYDSNKFGKKGLGKLVYNLLFESIYSKKEFKFIQDEYLFYLNNISKNHYLDKRIYTGHDIERKILGITDMAKDMGVQPSTLRRMINNGKINPLINEYGGRSHYLFDTTAQYPMRSSSGESFSERKAAFSLNLPVSVLKVLRKRDIYKTRYIGNKLGSYHEYDIQAFREKILREIKELEKDHMILNDAMTLSSVMQKKLCGPENKVDFICAILNEEIKPIGVVDGEISKIVFKKDDVIDFMRRLNETKQSSMLVVDAALRIKCDPAIMSDLISQELLTIDANSFYTRIKVNSLREFSTKYVSCAWVAEGKKTSSKSIVSTCEKREIKLLIVKRSHSDSVQPFMLRKDLNQFRLSNLPLYYSDT